MSQTQEELHQYLSFTLGNELFALDIGSVREIIDDKNITKIPRIPDYMRGVINIRGHAVPVVDLRLMFGMSRTEMGINNCVIITEHRIAGDMAVIGTLADSVQEVLEIQPEEIAPAPRMGTAIDARYIKGMARHGERFIILLDIDQVFSTHDVAEAVREVDSRSGEQAA